MPNAKLVNHLADLVEKEDDDEKAISIIRSLLLKGHLKKEDFVKGAKIGTLHQGSSFMLGEPEVVGKHIKASEKTVITTKKGAEATVVFMYGDNDAPKIVGGVTGGLTLVGTIEGGVDNDDLKHFKKITQSMIAKDHKSTIQNFFIGVAGLLAILERDSARFNRAKYYLAANPILSWFFLTLPGTNHGLVKSSELKDFNWKLVPSLELIRSAEESDDYKLNKSIMSKIKDHRGQLVNGDRQSLIGMIVEAYESTLPKMQEVGAIDSALAKNVQLKLLMDELRFVHEKSVDTDYEVEDTLASLGAINWSSPSKHLCVCSREVHNNLKCAEAFASGPASFVRSIYVLYVPLTEAVEKQLSGIQGGSIEGGNPAEVRSVIFSGGAARKKLSAHAGDVSLKSLVKVLSAKQRAALKAML